jgi:hypothetical protein
MTPQSPSRGILYTALPTADDTTETTSSGETGPADD